MEEGTVAENDRTDVVAIHFKETPAHASFDWHEAPEPQYVITLSGTLEFTTRDGETFVLRPGDVLVAEDSVGSGHKWRLIDDQPCAAPMSCSSPVLAICSCRRSRSRRAVPEWKLVVSQMNEDDSTS